MSTQENILLATQQVFALTGSEGINMRSIAKKGKIAPSVIYHYFANKEELLLQMYLYSNKQLGEKRAMLPTLATFEEMLQQRIEFQLDHAQAITAVLKYYLYKRLDFPKNHRGHLPDKSYLHIEEILHQAIAMGHFRTDTPVEQEAKIIVHAINGFVLEYFPARIDSREKAELIRTISSFILRALAVYKR